MDDHQDIEPNQSPSQAAGFLHLILGVILLLLVVVGLIAGWGTFLKAAPILVQILIVLVSIATPAAIMGNGVKMASLWFNQIEQARLVTKERRIHLHMQEAHLESLRAAQRRADEEHATRLHLLRTRLPANTEGNRDFIYDERSGQVMEVRSGHYIQPVPAHWAPHTVSTYKDTSSRVSEDKPVHGVLGAGITQPSQDWLLGHLPEQALIVSPGVQASTGQMVKVSICDVPHFKILGSTGFGKSCLAGSLLDQATHLNRPEVFQLACLDLEHKTSRLFEDLPHIAHCRVGSRLVQLVATDAEEVVEHLGYLKKVLDYRAGLSEPELTRQPVLVIYVEEMLSLQYEVVDPKQLKSMLADVTVLSVRGRKYGMFLIAVMQTDYSSEELRVSQKMFRFRAAAAIDQSAARAAGFQNTELIKQNFQHGQPGQFVIEYPSFSQLVLAPTYDVKRLVAEKTRASHDFTRVSEDEPSPGLTLLKPSRNSSETTVKTDETALQARLQEVRHLQALGWGKVAIIEKVWKVKAGATHGYKHACLEYDHILARLDQEEGEASDAGSSVWKPHNSDQSS